MPTPVDRELRRLRSQHERRRREQRTCPRFPIRSGACECYETYPDYSSRDAFTLAMVARYDLRWSSERERWE
jgi:hypothetical protein